MKTKLRLAVASATLGLAVLALTRTAKADIVPVFDAATPSANGCTFSYDVEVSDGSKVNKNDFFTIYDFNGYVAGSAFAPVDWTISVQNTGITPAGIDPSAFSGDDPNVVNLTFKYVGAAPLLGPALVGGAGAFGAESIFCATNDLGTYASNTHKYNPGHPDNNTRQANAGFTVTPKSVPEGSTLALLATGLVPLLGAAAKRSRRRT